ncbi:MAG: hypothetical protein WC297_03525 [Candidatus Paceibacterota bacterium]|jgi:hypothetical protein
MKRKLNDFLDYLAGERGRVIKKKNGYRVTAEILSQQKIEELVKEAKKKNLGFGIYGPASDQMKVAIWLWRQKKE